MLSSSGNKITTVKSYHDGYTIYYPLPNARTPTVTKQPSASYPMAMAFTYGCISMAESTGVMRYWQASKEKSLSLGVYPKVSLSDARKKRDELRKQLQAGLDPSAERKATNLRKELAARKFLRSSPREWYGKQLHTWVPHHASDVKRRLENNIFPSIGKRPIDEIQAPELLQTIRKIEARGAYDLGASGIAGMRTGVPLWHRDRALYPQFIH